MKFKGRTSNMYKRIKNLDLLRENARQESIKFNNLEQAYESDLYDLIMDNQNLPEQKKCHHGVYGWVKDQGNICMYCYWLDENPSCY
jgi:hypothetical protein